MHRSVFIYRSLLPVHTVQGPSPANSVPGTLTYTLTINITKTTSNHTGKKAREKRAVPGSFKDCFRSFVTSTRLRQTRFVCVPCSTRPRQLFFNLLRLLLHYKHARPFDDLDAHDGIVHPTFEDAASAIIEHRTDKSEKWERSLK